MSYKMIVCDMDGTLLSSSHKISEYTKTVIKKIKEKGIKLVIATGRPYLDASFFRKQLGLETLLISSNGARIHDEKGNIIFSKDIPEDISKKILDFNVDKRIYHRNLYIENDWFVEYEIDGLREFHIESGYNFKIENFDKFKNSSITKIFFLAEPNNIDILENNLKNNFFDDISIAASSPYCLEIMRKGVNKGEALKKIIEANNISSDEIVAFGDGLNDYEMLNLVGKGFVMSNASEKLKEKASGLEIIKSCDEDGVAKKLEEIFC